MIASQVSCLVGLLSFSALSMPAQENPRASTDAAAAGAPAPLELAGGLEQNEVALGEEAGFWLRVRNRSDRPLAGLCLDMGMLQDYEVRIESGALARAAAGGCRELRGTLAPGYSHLVRGKLKARSEQPARSVLAAVRWSPPGAGPGGDSQDAVVLGSLAVSTFWGRSLAWLREMGKDFGLPLILALIAVAFPFWQNHREKKQQQMEKQKEHERLKQEKERAQLLETWTMMLPESHRLATRFYVQIQQAARALLQSFGEREKAVRSGQTQEAYDAARKAFHAAALFHRRMRFLSEKAGGFYFKSRVGEEILRQCLAEFVRTFGRNKIEVRRIYSHMLDHVSVHQKIGEFLDELDAAADSATKGAMHEAWEDFRGWLDTTDAQRAMLSLKALRALLNYEMNRPYEYWYGQPEILKLDAESERFILELASRTAEEDPFLKDFHTQVKDYLEAGKTRST